MDTQGPYSRSEIVILEKKSKKVANTSNPPWLADCVIYGESGVRETHHALRITHYASRIVHAYASRIPYTHWKNASTRICFCLGSNFFLFKVDIRSACRRITHYAYASFTHTHSASRIRIFLSRTADSDFFGEKLLLSTNMPDSGQNSLNTPHITRRSLISAISADLSKIEN